MQGAYGAPPPQNAYGQNPGGGAPAAGGQLEVTTSFFPLAFILFLVTPTINIDGYPQKRAWGRHVFDLAPGEHHLHVSFPYMFNDKTGPAQARVPIYAGHITTVTYDAPFFMFSDGTMRVVGNRPMQAPPQLGYGGPPQGYGGPPQGY